ncbi:hypothetical protein OTU49_011545 [Cherax quadricarinatus]
MFAPRDRLRDSHYHSMYRTLRSARINYAAQAARFKDEGTVYKLVMDVREFVGGDVTVRTAGGTLSVRGRLEVGADSDSTSTSSKTSSARTLHRRFNLPPDADGEKVESILSRDAVLTVTIPKRTDVRVIPVTVEGDAAAGNRSATKRHSATQPDPGPTPSKRPQDHHTHTHKDQYSAPRDRSTSRGRQTFGLTSSRERDQSLDNERKSRREKEDELLWSKDRTSRRGSDTFTGGGSRDDNLEYRRKSYPEGALRAAHHDIADNVSGSRRRNRDIEEEELENKASHRNRRTSKYEEAKEISIPIRIEHLDDTEKVGQYPVATTEADKGITTASQSINMHDKMRSQEKEKQRPVVREEVNKETSKPSGKSSYTFPTDKSTINKVCEKENIKPPEGDVCWTYSNAYISNSRADDNSREKQLNGTRIPGCKEKSNYKTYKSQEEPEVQVLTPDTTVSSDAENNTQDKKQKHKDSIEDQDVLHKQSQMDERQKERAVKSNYLGNTSRDSESCEGRSKSPFGGREVKVEKKQSDMEGDMFKDCWQNFSSTLQEVLARLQELSSELGQPKTHTKTSPPSSADVLTERHKQASHSTSQLPTSTQVSSRSTPSQEEDKYQTSVATEGSDWVAGKTGTAVGVGRRPPTTPPPVYAEERSATRPGSNAHGTTYTRDILTQQDTHVPKTNQSLEADKQGTQQVSGSSVSKNTERVPWQGSGGGGGRGGARARDNTRPVSLVLLDGAPGDAVRHHTPMNLILDPCSSDALSHQVSKFQRNGSSGPRPRPTSLDVSQEGSLLKNLRKSSPVDALKDRFLSHLTPTSESSPSLTDVHYIPVAVEANKTVRTSGNVGEVTQASRAAAEVPLSQRRGRGVNTLVIADDDQSSTTSSQASTATEEDSSATVSRAGSQGGVNNEDEWRLPRKAAHLADKTITGNSSVLNLCPDLPKSQHSSSTSSSSADSRAKLDGIASGGVCGGFQLKPSPRLSSPSDSDPDVDKIISHAERVIEETRRLSASSTNDLPPVNDLGQVKPNRIKRETVKHTSKLPGFNLAPNIETRASPESNFVEIQDEDSEEEVKTSDNESQVVVEGCLSIPLPRSVGRPRPPQHKPPSEQWPRRPLPTHVATPPTGSNSLIIEAVDDNDDVAQCEEVKPTIVTSPEIQSSDVMGCARERGRGGTKAPTPLQEPPPPSTFTHQDQPTTAPRRPSSRERMGGLFSRGRSDDPARHTPPTTPTVTTTTRNKAPSPTPSTPTRTPKLRERSCTPQEEPHLPPYVRQKSDTSKRHSGFSHVQSDNVRKMREAWSFKQESPVQQRRGVGVHPSPPPSPRRAHDSPGRSSSRSTPTRDTAIRSTPTRDTAGRSTPTQDTAGRSTPTRDTAGRTPTRDTAGRSAPTRETAGRSTPTRETAGRSTPTRETGTRSPTRSNNYHNSTFSSRSRSSSSPRRSSTSSSDGAAAAPGVRNGGSNTYATAKSGRPLADTYSSGAATAAGSRASPARAARRPPPPPPPSDTPPASPFHQKIFRRLRDSSLQPDSETICFTEEADRYKLVMDVEEYVPGEIEVLQDDKHLTVKGRVETTQGGNTTTRTFHRNFHIPHNTREEDIDSALSRDGILTVYVPKKKERVIRIELTD